ncbi:hypothetical protein TVAG_414150 [Trichomonas vaginalis G3]|uniref:BTB domain-containing protein n=1 Tax=Trichomonas vaginalis (strain ATCC PRA-98 / G3) TaxID=412133 RepID=A2EC87_TRIV3|nr:ankyrin repeat domain-containing protein 49 family [Trichomonas vaginalis G3]EAY09764.1 hypothetical protein TVAG_414150 [Trichomonas vaginalis G3]KAI5550922.1 ankyrin repeat domain-containing protein 49 family [Trichomonas vaginalis G3]|eukprot:XP_001321987.1 hypothetical protein [Trichomonas vaginalis G3]
MSTQSSHRSKRLGYYIFLRDEKIKVDPVIFAKKSSYFAEQSASNPDGFEVQENVLKESFLTFLSYCQDKKYEINTDNANDLLKLSRNWNCTDLEGEVTDFCRKHKIVVRPKIDPLGNLIEAIDNQKESVQDLREVAKIINTLYDDDRLPDVEPELLYRIVIIAEKEFTLDKIKFKKFVLRLFKSNPDAAVILSLRLNFNELTDEEFEMIANCPEIRSQSLNFFAASSISIIRNRIKNNLAQFQIKNNNLLNKLNNQIRYQHEMFLYQLEEYKSQKKALIDQRLEQQKAEINDIYEQLVSVAAHLDGGILSENGLVDPRINQNINAAEKRFADLHQQIQEALEKDKQDRHAELKSGVYQRLKVWEAKHGDEDSQKKLLDEAFEDIGAISKDIQEKKSEIDEDLVHIKSAVNAKIVRDKIRSDKGRRDTANIWSIFDESERESVIKEDEYIQNVEKKIEEFCPIRKH